MSNQIIDSEEILRIVRRIVSTRFAVIEHRHDANDIDGLSGGSGGGSDTAWGDITGDISTQADLQAALDEKAAVSSMPVTMTTVIDTGSSARNRFSIEISDAAITPLSRVDAWINAVDVSGNQADNVEMDDLRVTAIPSSGILTLIIQASDGFLGNYSISYRY